MPWYVPPGAEGISTPALLVYPERIEENVQRMLHMVGNDPLRLWPHVKTSKCRHIIERMVAHGIRRFKGATLPELEIAL
ncbi:MAG: D-TA family PLP-dependent enzyme, partial [Verrucomicrobiota bacterium]|nr:D-TA family PLP-dependent enzyme [Verrucomicrobiota bacterium]